MAIEGTADIGRCLHWAEGDIRLRMEVPVRLMQMQGSFCYGGWHPFEQALRKGPEILREFYMGFWPQTLSEMYFLDGYEDRAVPPWELPWIARARRTPPPGEGGLPASEGVSYYGPASERKIAYEYDRLARTRRSIQRRGYDPNIGGGIVGHFMRAGSEYRFFVRGGKHRAAILASMGLETCAVEFRKGWPRCVSLDDAPLWPLVVHGALTKDFAEAVFLRYFEFDGTQQWEWIRKAAAERRAEKRSSAAVPHCAPLLGFLLGLEASELAQALLSTCVLCSSFQNL